MPTPHFTMPEIIFAILVVTCFVTFAITLAGVHLYVSRALQPQPRRKAVGAISG